MKSLLVFAALVAVPAFCQTAPAPAPAPAPVRKPVAKTAAKTTAKPAPAAKPLVIPKDATPNPDGSYSWADKAGKKWIFSKTPFGISRVADTGERATLASAPASQDVKATEVGDKILFERPSPFGTSKWEKNKADLTDADRAILAAQPTTAKKPE